MVLTTLSDYIGFSLLWALPFVQAFKLVDFFKIPTHTSSGRAFPETYDSKLEEELKEELHVFHEKHTRMNPKIIEIWNPNYTESIDSLILKRAPILLMLPHLKGTDKEAFLWLYKHEYAHLLGRHALKLQLLKLLTTTLCAVIFNFYYNFSFVASIVSITLLTPLFHLLISYLMNIQADNFTLKNASTQETQGGLRFLKAAYSSTSKKSFFKGRLPSFLYLIRLRKIKKHLLCHSDLDKTSESLEFQLEALLQKNKQEEELFIESQKEKVLKWIDADNDD